jgi:hypothetical protein
MHTPGRNYTFGLIALFPVDCQKELSKVLIPAKPAGVLRKYARQPVTEPVNLTIKEMVAQSGRQIGPPNLWYSLSEGHFASECTSFAGAASLQRN